MMSLLLEAVIPDQAPIVDACLEQHIILGISMLFFILFASLTIMNMLVGVLVEVISYVAAVEKEQKAVGYVRMRLEKMFAENDIDEDCNQLISQKEFESLLVNKEAINIIQDMGVDALGLVDLTDYIFRNSDEITFADFMEIVLQLRGSNNSTVKDLVDFRRCIYIELHRLEDLITSSCEAIELVAQHVESRPPNGKASVSDMTAHGSLAVFRKRCTEVQVRASSQGLRQVADTYSKFPK